MLLSFSHQIVSNSRNPLNGSTPGLLSLTVSRQSLPKLMSIASVMSPNHLILSPSLPAYAILESKVMIYALQLRQLLMNDYISYFSQFREVIFSFAHCQIMWQCYVTDLKVTRFNGKQTWWYKDRHCSNFPQLCTTSFLRPPSKL